MTNSAATLAVYTTLYPGVEPYVPDWYESLASQSDQEFQVWVGLDGVTIESAERLVGANREVNWIVGRGEVTPGKIRQQALLAIVNSCAGVVLVDSDDVLYPTRIAAARAGLGTADLTGCALTMIDQQGHELDLKFDLPLGLHPEEVFPRNNVFGFSNSAYRTDLLTRCLPIPADSILVDWYLATRAWLFGAKLGFDHVPRMYYRQHSANTARVRGPFRREQIISDTNLVRQHFRYFAADPKPDYVTERYAELSRVAADIERFHERIVLKNDCLERYVRELNDVRVGILWWSCVAHPALKHLWN